jgi:type VI secretion system protein ImpG
MAEDLLRYYDRELRFLQKLSADFAARNPKVGLRLRISEEKIEDPHVRRLVEGVALLNARIRSKLDDEFPELTHGLLTLLEPHLVSPMPSLSILQFAAKPDLTAAHVVPKGTQLESEPVDGVRCRFQTVYPVEAWPIRVAGARLVPTPFQAPPSPVAGDAAAVLEIRLECTAPQGKFAELAPERLRFYLNVPPQHAGALYELLLNDALGLALASDANDPAPALLPPEALRPVGFEADEGLVPYPSQSFLGYRLLSEFFAFPEKFLFVDLEGLPAQKFAKLGREARLYVYVRRSQRELEGLLEKDKAATSLALGCTPVVNLFRQRADPLELDRHASELCVVPDQRRRGAHEVWSVDSMTAVTAGGREFRCAPFFGVDRFGGDADETVWWTATRRAEATGEDEEHPDDGPTEMWLTVVEHGLLKDEPDVVLETRITATNRDLPQTPAVWRRAPALLVLVGGRRRRAACAASSSPPTRSAARSRIAACGTSCRCSRCIRSRSPARKARRRCARCCACTT